MLREDGKGPEGRMEREKEALRRLGRLASRVDDPEIRGTPTIVLMSDRFFTHATRPEKVEAQAKPSAELRGATKDRHAYFFGATYF